MRNSVRRRGREQHVRPVSVPAGSNSPVDCWKVRGSLRSLISWKGGCAPSPPERLRASPCGSRSARGEAAKNAPQERFLHAPAVCTKKRLAEKQGIFLLCHIAEKVYCLQQAHLFSRGCLAIGVELLPTFLHFSREEVTSFSYISEGSHYPSEIIFLGGKNGL